jgi:transposase-like protein
MTRTGYLPRYRYPIIIIRIAVILHIYLKSRTVALLLYILFRVKVSHKSICEWTWKFSTNMDLPYSTPRRNKTLICHVDEKYVKVKGSWHYWWSLKDSLGNVISWVVTMLRDFNSAKELFRRAKAKIGRDVDILVRDGLPAYDKATKFLGRKCKGVIAGINGKGFMFKKNLYWLTNNPAESLNSEIDFYLARFQNNFSNLESANRFADIFMLQKYLKKCFAEKKLSEASSLLVQAIDI